MVRLTCKRPGCDQLLEFGETYCGTCLVITWNCHTGHDGGKWASQPTCAALRAGNLLLASSIVIGLREGKIYGGGQQFARLVKKIFRKKIRNVS